MQMNEGGSRKKVKIEAREVQRQETGLFHDERIQLELDKYRNHVIEYQAHILNSRAQRKKASKGL